MLNEIAGFAFLLLNAISGTDQSPEIISLLIAADEILFDDDLTIASAETCDARLRSGEPFLIRLQHTSSERLETRLIDGTSLSCLTLLDLEKARRWISNACMEIEKSRPISELENLDANNFYRVQELLSRADFGLLERLVCTWDSYNFEPFRTSWSHAHRPDDPDVDIKDIGDVAVNSLSISMLELAWSQDWRAMDSSSGASDWIRRLIVVGLYRDSLLKTDTPSSVRNRDGIGGGTGTLTL